MFQIIERGNGKTRIENIPFLLWGILSIIFGLMMYCLGFFLVFPRYLLFMDAILKPLAVALIWYSGVPLMIGLILIGVDLFVFLPRKRRVIVRAPIPVNHQNVVVALTAYNDEESIAPAVKDFLDYPGVSKVIVVSNNSRDKTFEVAVAAGAYTVNELSPGYGYCVYRCLQEALAVGAQTIILCEGDCTFRAADISKLLAYAPHADIVNGTRTVELLREPHTQLSTFMYYGNLFVAKLMEAKHLGKATLTDMGTTYKLCHRDSLQKLMPFLDPSINLEFNAHFLDQAMKENLSVLECPVSFHPRVGESKGGNTSNSRALIVGIRMIKGIVLGWKI